MKMKNVLQHFANFREGLVRLATALRNFGVRFAVQSWQTGTLTEIRPDNIYQTLWVTLKKQNNAN
jgi:hypothetical protein